MATSDTESIATALSPVNASTRKKQAARITAPQAAEKRRSVNKPKPNNLYQIT